MIWNRRIEGMSDSKVSTLDFMVSVLKEHEKVMDSLIKKFNKALKNLLAASEKLLKNPSAAAEKGGLKTIMRVKHNVNILCEEWSEFAEACSEPEVVSFQLDGELRVKALQGNIICEYREPIHRHVERLQCGIPVKFQASLDPSKVKRFLSDELKIPEKKIIRGELLSP